MMIIEGNEILNLIPHRGSSLLIKKVEVDTGNKSGKGYYNGIFSSLGILNIPGKRDDLPLSCLMEGIFQTAGVTRKVLDSGPGDKLLAKLTKVLYKGIALPTSEIYFEVILYRVSRILDYFTGAITCDGQKILECEVIVGGKLLDDK